MFERIIRRICGGVKENKTLWNRPDTKLSAAHQAGYINALLDVLSLIGHDVTVECGEPEQDGSLFLNITIDGINLVHDAAVDKDAKLALLNANKGKTSSDNTTPHI